MTQLTKGRALTLALVLAFTPQAARAGSRSLQSSAPTNTGVLPLVVTGAQAPALIGHRPSELTVLACSGERPQPLLFQIDELNDEGRVVSFYGESGRVAPDATPGVIDADDELVLMLRDLGRPCPPAQLAKLRGEVHRLDAAAPHLKENGVAYLVLNEKGYVPPGSYVSYEAATHTVKSPGYLWGYDPRRPFFYDRVGFGDYQGGAHADVFDRIKTRVRANALGGLAQIRINEDDFESRLDGVRVGPVRVTRELSVKVRVLPGLVVDALLTFHHYERSRDARARIKMPAPAALFTSSLDVSFVHDFTNMKGTRVSTAKIPQGLLTDGKTARGEGDLEYGEKVWSLMTGMGVNEMLVLEYDEALRLTPKLSYVDGPDAQPPEEVPGALPAVGFEFSWLNLKAQWYEFSVAIFALPQFPEGGGGGFYDTYKAKPEITLTALGEQS